MSQGPQQVTQTSKVELTPEQNELIKLAMPNLRQFASNPPKLPDFSRIQGFDPAQTAGQNMALGAVPGQQQMAAGGAGATNWFNSGSPLYPDSNPALRGTIDAAVRPIQQNLVENTLPAIRSEFVGAGYGGSRQGIAEGLASRGASSAMADASSKISTDAYQSGLDAMIKSMSLTPSMMQAQTMPAFTNSAVGDVRQGMGQAKLSEKAGDFSYEQMLPYLMGSDIVSLVNGIPGAGATTTGTMPRQDPLSSILGFGSSMMSFLPFLMM